MKGGWSSELLFGCVQNGEMLMIERKGEEKDEDIHDKIILAINTFAEASAWAAGQQRRDGVKATQKMCVIPKPK